ncbi:MAG: hypothetical protein HYV09_34220 [Deltaproteobacteria bacterium]|nr:hypothetical protein [Deltaproteobacteria bacterium]
MVRLASALAASVAATLVIPAVARAEIAVAARPELGLQGGSESFDLAFAIPQASDPTTSYEASSELTYPLNTTLGGVAASVDAGSFAFFGSVHTNLHHPWGKMVDSDFITARTASQSQTIEFSHTESRAELRLWNAELGVGARVAQLSPAVRALVTAGFRYESYAHDVRGASGWQLDQTGSRVSVALPDDTLALTYDTRYRIAFLGVRVDGQLSPNAVFVTEARVLGSWSSHEDDHVLRHKIARSEPYGLGFALSGGPALRVGKSMHLGLSLQLQYLRAVSGSLKQRYYADDPYLDGDQTQLAIPEVDFSFTLLRATLLAFAEARF